MGLWRSPVARLHGMQKVTGSIPVRSTLRRGDDPSTDPGRGVGSNSADDGVEHRMVRCVLCKDDVAGSNPVYSTQRGVVDPTMATSGRLPLPQ